MKISIMPILRKDKIKKDKTAPIHIRVIHNRKSRFIGTGVTIPIDGWDVEKHQVKTNLPERKELQLQIDKKISELHRRMKKLEALELEVSLDNLLETNGRKVNCTIGECLDATISRLESLGKYGSASKHKSLRSRLAQYRTLNTRLDEIDLTFLRDFELFLRRIGNTNNSIATKFAIFKAAYNKALAEEQFVTKSNPFSKFKVGSLWTKTRKRAITKEDVQKLMELKIEPSHQTEYRDFARDIFLFSYYTAGINFTDIASLRYSDVVGGRISYARNKTQKLLSFQLMPKAVSIIEKYSRSEHSSDDYIFPILDRRIHITPQQIFNRTHKTLRKVNRELKVLGEMIGLRVPLTTYVARHTYATVLKRSGVNIAIISESLGHSDLSTTQIYLDSFENSQIDEAMKNLL